MRQWTRSTRAHNSLPSRPLTITTSTTTTTTPTPRDTRSEPQILYTVRTLCARDQLQNALSLFYAASPTCDSQTYATLLHTCARLRRLSDGHALHRHHSQFLDFQPNLFATNHLINMYAKCGSLDCARKVFDEMPHRNIVSWTVLISGYDQHGHSEECFNLFSSMVSHCRPNEFAFASVISSSCGSRERGQQVHAMAFKAGFDGCVYVGNALITMYFKSSSGGGEDYALSVFDSMPAQNLVTWNSMIAGFQHCGLVGKCIEFFSKMHGEGVGFDRSTIVSIAAALCTNIINSSDDKHIYYCCQLHCLAVKIGLVLDVEVATALVKAYAIVGGDLDNCYKLFAEISSEQDIVSWTALMTAFAERKQEEALLLFHQLRLQDDINLDCYTFSIAIKASAGLPTENTATAIHALVIKYGFEGEMALDNALIHAYARCGSINLSMQVFDCMRARDIVSWNSVFKACSVHGRGREALELFARMNVQPDAATFVALLSACSHSGLVAEGTELFNSMFACHGVIPQCDHYACMIDILGRVGRLAEAEALINQMPMQPDSVMWSALLGACRKHGETKMAELASKKLMELDPKNSLSYVSMSNAYCSKGVFDEAALVRKKMRKCEVKKEPGLSWIEVGNRVHEFAAGGWRHAQRDTIYCKLEWLIGNLKGMGYAPERSVDLHDIEEEQKEQQLYYHSEKLALAFALTNADTCFNGGRAIRIMKNIRICIDCHNFMKIASDFVQRDIIVRDANRFHHFKGGACSCKDYW